MSKYLIGWCIGSGNSFDRAAIIDADNNEDAQIRAAKIALDDTRDEDYYIDKKTGERRYYRGLSLLIERFTGDYKDTKMYRSTLCKYLKDKTSLEKDNYAG